MAIKVKAIERNVAFEKNTEKWAYVLQPELYNKLSQSKVISEASLRSGIPRGSINAAWDAIGEVVKRGQRPKKQRKFTREVETQT